MAGITALVGYNFKISLSIIWIIFSAIFLTIFFKEMKILKNDLMDLIKNT
jgi:hypothetical protein